MIKSDFLKKQLYYNSCDINHIKFNSEEEKFFQIVCQELPSNLIVNSICFSSEKQIDGIFIITNKNLFISRSKEKIITKEILNLSDILKVEMKVLNNKVINYAVTLTLVNKKIITINSIDEFTALHFKRAVDIELYKKMSFNNINVLADMNLLKQAEINQKIENYKSEIEKTHFVENEIHKKTFFDYFSKINRIYFIRRAIIGSLFLISASILFQIFLLFDMVYQHTKIFSSSSGVEYIFLSKIDIIFFAIAMIFTAGSLTIGVIFRLYIKHSKNKMLHIFQAFIITFCSITLILNLSEIWVIVQHIYLHNEWDKESEMYILLKANHYWYYSIIQIFALTTAITSFGFILTMSLGIFNKKIINKKKV